MSHVQTTTAARRPEEASRAVRDETARLRSAVFAGEIEAARAPDQALRHALEARRADLDGWLRPARRAVVEAEIGALLGVMAPGRSEDDAAFSLGLYVEAVAGLPAFAVKAACAHLLRHGAGQKRHAPSPPEVREAAEREAARWRQERADLTRILEATVQPARSSPEERARLAAEARRAFRIPEPLPAGPGQVPTLEDGAEQGSLAAFGRDILLRPRRGPSGPDAAPEAGEHVP